MKRNIVPLLGIAFVVAIASTGIFYGLFAGRLRSSVGELPGQSIVVAAKNLDRGAVIQAGDLQISQVKGSLKGAFSSPEQLVGATVLEPIQQSEPILDRRVASRDAKAGQGAGRVPAGMRAVSIRVSESSGVVGLLQPGNRVDIQAVSNRTTIPELRTILQNVEVLAVSPQPEASGGGQPPVPVVTILTRAQDSDLVALADSGARIRLALRNPLDDGTGPRRALPLPAVFEMNSGSGAETRQAARASGSAPASGWEHPIRLHVRALGVSAEALGELNAKLAGGAANDSLDVVAFRSDADADALVRGLEQKKELEIVSSWRLTAGVGRPTSFRAGAGAGDRLRVQFSREIDARGSTRLRVKPEIRIQRPEGVETLRYDAGMRDGESFLVKGFLKEQSDASVLGRIYPGHSWSGRQLVLLVTTRDPERPATSAMMHANRGQ